MAVRVLLIDGHDRRSLAAVRSLGARKGEYEVFIGSSRRINSSRFSRFCSGFVRYPDPYTRERAFIEFLSRYVESNHIQVLIPMGDSLTELIVQNMNSFRGSTEVLAPEIETFNIARDKSQTLKYAQECGVPIPRLYSLDDVKRGRVVEYPLVIKPRISSASRGMKIAANRDDALEFYNEVDSQFPRPIIQEMIPDVGEHYQANLLFDKHHVLRASCVKKKIRQFPISGGPSTFFKTVEHNGIEDLAIKLLESIKWVGPAEVEFMVDPRDNTPKLMEINPRLSATIRLSCFAGVDFPYLIVKNALGEETDLVRNRNFDYYCQWLIPGDIANFLFNKDRFRQEHGYFFRRPDNFCHMTYDSNDVAPFFYNLLAYGISMIDVRKLARFIKR